MMKFKKCLFLVVAPLLLTGCQKTSSSVLDSSLPSSQGSESTSGQESTESPELEKVSSALSEISSAVRMTGDYLSMYPSDGSTYDEGDYDIQIGADYYFVERNYTDSYESKTSEEHIFQAGEDGKIEEQKRTLLNDVQFVDYVNPHTEETMEAKDYLSNPFQGLKAEDFQSVGDGLYELSEEKLSSFAGFASFENIRPDRFYSCEIESAVFEILDGHFTTGVVTTKAQSDGFFIPDDFLFEYTFQIAKNSLEEMPSLEPYKHEEGHDKLQKAFDSLESKVQSGNYTVWADDEETGGEFSMEYVSYYTEDVLYSDFRPALIQYTEGYKRTEGETFQHFNYHNYGEEAGTVTLQSKGENAYRDRKWLDVDVTGFAVEFFHEDRNNVFATSDPQVVADISTFLCPFIDKLDPYYIASEVVIELDEQGDIASIQRTAYDWAAGYTDVFTYTIGDFGSTSIPEEVLSAL